MLSNIEDRELPGTSNEWKLGLQEPKSQVKKAAAPERLSDSLS
jgi:hypothetical protein